MSSKKKNVTRTPARQSDTGKTGSSARKTTTSPTTGQWPLPNTHKDDLQEIKGIGMSTEAALNRSGIMLYEDFSRKTAAEIADLLQSKEGVTISAEEIRRSKWIEQARQLAEEQGQTGPVEEPARRERKSISGEAQVAVAADASSEETTTAAETERSEETSNEQRKASAQPAKVEESPTAKTGVAAQSTSAQTRKPSAKQSSAAASKPASVGKAKPRPEPAPTPGLNQDAAQVAASLQPAPRESFAGIVRATFHQEGNNMGRKPILMSDVKLRLRSGESRPETIHVEVHAEEAYSARNQVLASATYPRVVRTGDLDVRLECRTPRLGRYNLKVVAFELRSDARVHLYKGPQLQIVA